MHESTIARRVLSAVLARMDLAGEARVLRVRGWIAETEALSPESVRFHFDLAARGTPAEGARLELDLRRVSARCRTCASIYEPDHHLVLCPACSSTDGELLGPTGVGIESMEVEPR